ncbi:MAG: hypothetical protein QOI71_3755 [Gaiellales bacterium]|nr:hypothetical protein [Gaiellales bacterium]
MEFVLLHIPHIIPAFIAMGFLGRFAVLMADQPPAELSDAQIEEWRRVRSERARSRRVRKASARLGLLSLPFIVLAVATGLWLYTIALRDDRPSALAIWLHIVTSAVALALVTSKVAESGRLRLSRALDPSRFLTDGLSLILAALAVPLVLTGVILLFSPGSSSANAYAHLVGSAWWMTLFGVHLMRYLGRSIDAALRGKAAPE